MFTLVDSRSRKSERNGTNGSWKCRMSNRSRSSMSSICVRYRGENVSVPTEALIGTETPTPSRMMSPSEERCGPWLAVRIRTSWPRWRRPWYRNWTCCATPPLAG